MQEQNLKPLIQTKIYLTKYLKVLNYLQVQNTEDFKHVFSWQNAIFYNLNKSQLVAKFIDDPSKPVTVLTPKSELMDRWSIEELKIWIELLRELSYHSYKQPNKDELIAQVKDARRNTKSKRWIVTFCTPNC